MPREHDPTSVDDAEGRPRTRSLTDFRDAVAFFLIANFDRLRRRFHRGGERGFRERRPVLGRRERVAAALMMNSAFTCEKVLDKTTPLDAIFEEQQKLTPNAKGYEIVVPVAGTDRAVTMAKSGSFAGFCKPDVYYWDQYTGKRLGVSSCDDLSFAEQFRSLIVPFHTGKIFGAASRYVLFLACLIGVVLCITGYTTTAHRYVAKDQARRRKLAREAEEAAKAQEKSERP